MRVVSTLTHLANKATEAGSNVVVSALTANLDSRDYVRDNANNVLFCYIECSIETCAKRDPKGLYSKAREGKINTLIGYNSKYIPPENPEIVVNTDYASAPLAVDIIWGYLRKNCI